MDPITAGVSVGLGLLSTGGQIAANRANRQMAREQMRFQERMSSTAAQRAVKDFEAAGLNPALAYGQQASSPGGSTAGMEDVAGPGVSSAQAARRLQQELQINRQQADADLRLKAASTEARLAEGRTAIEHGGLFRSQMRQVDQDIRFRALQQPYDLRYAGADALLRELLLPTARNEARYSERLGEFRPALGDIMSGARAAGSLLPALRLPVRRR